VIGVTGLRGSGKSLAARAARKLGIPVLEMRKPVVALMRKHGIKVTNRSLRLFADEIRRKRGKAVSARLATAEIRKLGGPVVLVNGVRSSAEIEEFRKNFEFKLIAVTAPVRVRFGRILKRRRRDDPRKYSDFLWSERMERKWGLAKAIASADYAVKNDGTRAGCEKELRLALKRLLA
ncbi:MAG: AAA family ATPase, partial [Candidatus Burarchaeum sp.]